jgi:hypothetical protein
VSDASNPSAVEYTAGVLKTLRALPTITLAASPSGNVPPGASVQLTATVSGSGNTFAWSNSVTGNPITVTPASTTSFTSTVTDQYGCQKTSSGLSVNVVALAGGVIASSASDVCVGDVPAAMTSSSAATGASGSNYTYQWQSSTTSSSSGFSTISGATSATFTPSQAATQTTYYRRVATNLSIPVNSNVLTFTVNALPTSLQRPLLHRLFLEDLQLYRPVVEHRMHGLLRPALVV